MLQDRCDRQVASRRSKYSRWMYVCEVDKPDAPFLFVVRNKHIRNHQLNFRDEVDIKSDVFPFNTDVWMSCTDE